MDQVYITVISDVRDVEKPSLFSISSELLVDRVVVEVEEPFFDEEAEQ